MNELDHFLSTSNFDRGFALAVSDAASAMFEATSINKDYLKREAAATGDPERFQTARQAVQGLWAQEDMGSQLNEKAAQKVLNILYLMEIRQPGFTTADRLHAIHDLYVGNMLDTKFLSQVNSDTTPDQAAQALASATEHQVRSAKVYPDLTDEEEAIWNRVKVYHEFDDGFKWIYAVNADGTIASHIPSSITFKTMHHCGNTPDARSDNQYWELRGPDGKAYLTVILTPDGKIEESKSWGNQPNKYRRMIQPYVKWFLKNKVTGVGYRYDYGYATHNNYGVKDFMGDDPEFIEYVTENKPELFGNTEKRIMFWKEALREGVVTVDDIKGMYADGYTLQDALGKSERLRHYHSGSRFKDWGDDRETRYHYRRTDSIFGDNPFDVVCAACDGCPFTQAELSGLILNKKVSLEEFANYDIHMLTPEVQKEFVQAEPYNLDRLMRIAAEVGTFEVTTDIMSGLVDIVKNGRPSKPDGFDSMSWEEAQDNPVVKKYRDDANRWDSSVEQLKHYMLNTNPPEKARPVVDAVLGNEAVANDIFSGLRLPTGRRDRWNATGDAEVWLRIYARYSDLELPDSLVQYISDYLFGDTRKNSTLIAELINIGHDRIAPIFANRSPRQIARACLDTSGHLKLDARNLLTTVKNLGDLVAIFPEYHNVVNELNPALRLGYYCCAPDEAIDADAAVAMAIRQIRKGSTESRNRNAMLSAMDAATMMAICRFPEVMEQVTPEDVADYVFPLSQMIEHSYIRDGARLINEHMIGILKEGYMSYDPHKQSDYATYAARLLMCAHRVYNVIEPGDPIFNLLYVYLARRRPHGDITTAMTGYYFYPRIPASEWDDTAKKIGSQEVFIQTYILPALNNGKFDDIRQDLLGYLVDFIMAPGNRLHSVLTDSNFRRRPILNRVKEMIRERIESGEEVSPELADQLNSRGILAKSFVDRASLKRFDSQSEAEIDESIVSQLDRMCSASTLKKYKTSRNFPYFVNEVLRANLEQFDLAYSEHYRAGDTESDEACLAAYRMYCRFASVADFILGSPKTPTCLAAAKLARRTGLLTAYRMASERFATSRDEAGTPLYQVVVNRYGETLCRLYSINLAPGLRTKIHQLDELGKGKQKYKPEEGEFPMKQK